MWGETMVTVYVDVLVGLNWFVNYFILLGVSKIGKTPLKFWRNLLSGFVLSLGSLAIFLPPMSFLLEGVFRLFFAAVGVLTAFGFGSLRLFLKNLGMFFAATFAYGGIMLGLWYVFRPENMVIHNSVSYISLSPIMLIVFTLISYGVLRLLRKYFGKESGIPSFVTLHIRENNKTVTLQAKVDTGFVLEDIYSHHPMILISPKISKKLWDQPLQTFRLLPYETVSGEGMLPLVTVKGITACCENKTVFFHQVSVALGEKEFTESFQGLVGYDFIERMTDEYERTSKNLENTSSEDVQKKNRLYQRLGNLTTPFKTGGGTTTDGTVENRRS